MPGESYQEAYRREQGMPSYNIETTEITIEPDGGDSYLVTERPQMIRKPSDSFGVQKNCIRDRNHPETLTCTEMTIR